MSGQGQPAGPGRVLRGRRSERGVLDRLAGAVRDGQSRVLVLYGEPGVGKTMLLDYLAGRAPGCRVVRAAGVQSEMELAFAGLHQLCAPMLDRLDRLPEPQQEALRTAFGLSSAPSPAGPAGPVDGPRPKTPDRFLVSLAVLSLLSEVAAERPLLCVVDDQQWLDRASAQAFGFVARRLAADPVGLVFGTRAPGAELAGLPELPVAGLRDDDARALLGSALPGPLDTRVRDQIVAEARGNPLALLELPRGMTPGQLAGGFGLPGAVSLPGRIEDSFRRQLDALPAQTRQLLLLRRYSRCGGSGREKLMTAARRSVLRVEEFLPCPKDRVWRALTDADLIARWLMPNDFRLQAGHRFAITSDPIRRCGTGGAGHCEVLAFDEGTMLRIAWTAAESMSELNSAATFTVTPEGAGTRLLVEHDGVHERLFTIVGVGCGPDGCRKSTRHIGEAAATIDGWHAAIGRLAEALRLRLQHREQSAQGADGGGEVRGTGRVRIAAREAMTRADLAAWRLGRVVDPLVADYQRRLLAAGHLAFVFPSGGRRCPRPARASSTASRGVTNLRWTDYASVTAEISEQRAGMLERTEQASAAL